MMIEFAIQRQAAGGDLSAEAAMYRACLLRVRP
jgi:multidrug efflux pump subunit AcrB